LSKFFFGLFTFCFGLALGLLFGSFISRLFPENINPMLQGTFVVLVVIITFLLWRLSERWTSKKEITEREEAKPPKP
jgi:hypothetical protein